MSARGLCNQEVSAARRLIEASTSNDQLLGPSAKQLLFAFQCFLQEVAELHSMPINRDYSTPEDVLAGLQSLSGADASIAELEVVAQSRWLIRLYQHCSPSRRLYEITAKSLHRQSKAADSNLISVSQDAEIFEEMSSEFLQEALSALSELITQSRELNQEY